MRVVKIEKIGKSTYIEVSEGESKDVAVINKLTNLRVVNNILSIEACDMRWNIKYEEIEDKLTSLDIIDYVKKASEIFLFNQ